MPLTRSQKAKMDPNNDPLVNPTWNMDLSMNQQSQSRRPTILPTNTNKMPSIDEIQHNLTQEELEATQQDPTLLMVLNALIHNDRDRYLTLLVQNGAKLSPGINVVAIFPLGVTLTQNVTRAPSEAQTQAATTSTQSTVAYSRTSLTSQTTPSVTMLRMLNTSTQATTTMAQNTVFASTSQPTLSVAIESTYSGQNVNQGSTKMKSSS